MSVSERRSYLRADDRRAQILAVATRVFAARGIRDANIADICKAAKIARGTLYQYFDNKQSVLLAVLDGIGDRIAAALARRQPLAAIPGLARVPDEMVVAFCSRRVRELLDAVLEDEATLRLVLRDARGLDGAVDRILARIDELLLGAMEADIRTAQSAGLARAEVDPALAAQFILGGVEKVVLRALAAPADQPVDLDAIVRATVELQLFGLLARPEETP